MREGRVKEVRGKSGGKRRAGQGVEEGGGELNVIKVSEFNSEVKSIKM